MFKKITALSLSLILALTAALCFSGAPAMAGPILNTYNENFSLGPVGLRYVSSSAVVMYDNVESYGANNFYRFSQPMHLGFNLNNATNVGKYITGFFSVDIKTSWAFGNGFIRSFDWSYVGSGSSGDGFNTGFYVNMSRDTITVYLVLDNYLVQSNSDSFMYFGLDVTNYAIVNNDTEDTASFTAAVTNASLSSYDITDSASGDLSSVIAGSINSTTSIQQILSTLSAIASDTDLLQSVVNKLDNISGILANLYSQLQQGNSYLAGLGWALAGIDITAANGATVSQVVYDRWVDIITDALDGQAPDTSEQETQLSDQEQQLQDKEALESQAFDFSNNNISTIDWNINVPDQIAGAALVIMAMVSDIWNRLGILQFAVTAACTVGLVTIILGVVNRFSSIKARESRRAAKGNKSPGNENKTN